MAKAFLAKLLKRVTGVHLLVIFCDPEPADNGHQSPGDWWKGISSRIVYLSLCTISNDWHHPEACLHWQKLASPLLQFIMDGVSGVYIWLQHDLHPVWLGFPQYSGADLTYISCQCTALHAFPLTVHFIYFSINKLCFCLLHYEFALDFFFFLFN